FPQDPLVNPISQGLTRVLIIVSTLCAASWITPLIGFEQNLKLAAQRLKLLKQSKVGVDRLLRDQTEQLIHCPRRLSASARVWTDGFAGQPVGRLISARWLFIADSGEGQTALRSASCWRKVAL